MKPLATQVLIQFFAYEGIKSINKLDGMWAFTLFNIENQQTIICRDRFGEKNLYYFETDKIHFSSEAAPLVKNINLKD